MWVKESSRYCWHLFWQTVGPGGQVDMGVLSFRPLRCVTNHPPSEWLKSTFFIPHDSVTCTGVRAQVCSTRWNDQSGSGQCDLLQPQPAPRGKEWSCQAMWRRGRKWFSLHPGSSGQPRLRGDETIPPLHGRAERVLQGGEESTGPFWIPPTTSSV